MKTIHITENAIKHHEELSRITNPNCKEQTRSSSRSSTTGVRRSHPPESVGHKTRVMMILASTIASQALGEYKVMARQRSTSA